MRDSTQPWLFVYKGPYMQRVADLVRTGHLHYVCGEISLVQFGQLHTKFQQRFNIHRTVLQSSRDRAQGKASHRLLAWWDASGECVHWILLCHPGKAGLDASELWQDAHDVRVRLTGYELIRQTRPGASKPAYTWGYQAAHLEALRSHCIHAIRSRRDHELKQVIDNLAGTAGFSRARAQAGKFKLLIQREWAKHRKNETCPPLPERFGYVRRLPDKGAYWVDLCKKVSAERRGRTQQIATSESA